MLEAAFWGLVHRRVALGRRSRTRGLRPAGHRWIGLAMAFGAGALIAAVAYELVLEAFETSIEPRRVRLRHRSDRLLSSGTGCSIAGAVTGGRASCGESQLAGSANAIVLGTVLDGIPESFVLGASIQEDGLVPVAVVVGVFVSNVPEALSGTSGLLEAGWTRGRVFAMWSMVVAVSVVAAAVGWALLDVTRTAEGAFALAFAGGALLVMLADTLMPEAFELGGREAGLLTALGFALGFALVRTSDAQQRARQAGRAAVALLRDLVAAVDDHVDPRSLHPPARLRVAVERERTSRRERKDVRALRLELLVGHLDDLDPALSEEVAAGEPGAIRG